MKFLFTTLPSNDLGLLTRSLPIARELKQRGHTIAFCSPAQAPSKLIKDGGFANLLPENPFYALVAGDFSLSAISRLLRSPDLGRDIGLLTRFLARMVQTSTAEIWNIDQFISLLGSWNPRFIQANVDAILDVIARYQPDAVIDFWNPFACIAARVARKPLITVIQADMHPLSKGFIWWKTPPSDLPDFVQPMNQALTAYGLPGVAKMGEILLGDKTLVLGIPELDPLPSTADVTYIGPVLWEREGDQLPDWIFHLRPDQPVVWVYSGNPKYAPGIKTAFDSSVVLSACIEALQNEPIQVVISTGHHPLSRKFLPLPSNFYHVPYLPGLAMAERSDLLIHHGGYGSCQTGLYTGTPALIIPTYSERESNARRVAAVGAGEFLVPDMDASGRRKHIRPEDVRVKVHQLLSTPSYKEKAMAMQGKLRSYRGPVQAADLIEKALLST